MSRNEIPKHIAIDPRVCFGKPVVRGTRVWVALIVNLLAGGDTIESVLADYPQLTEDDVLACLAFAAQMVDFHDVDIEHPGSACSGRVN